MKTEERELLALRKQYPNLVANGPLGTVTVRAGSVVWAALVRQPIGSKAVIGGSTWTLVRKETE